MMSKLDFNTVVRNIHAAIWEVERVGLRPSRVYMNTSTFHALLSVFHERVVTIIPDGTHRRPTIYGVRIAISDDLEDYEVDVSARS